MGPSEWPTGPYSTLLPSRPHSVLQNPDRTLRVLGRGCLHAFTQEWFCSFLPEIISNLQKSCKSRTKTSLLPLPKFLNYRHFTSSAVIPSLYVYIWMEIHIYIHYHRSFSESFESKLQTRRCPHPDEHSSDHFPQARCLSSTTRYSHPVGKSIGYVTASASLQNPFEFIHTVPFPTDPGSSPKARVTLLSMPADSPSV